MKDIILSILSEIEPDSDFNGSDDFFEDELIDSLGIMAFITALEERCSIHIDAGDIKADNFENLDSIQELLSKYM